MANANAQAPIIPVQTCKINPPRDVTSDETRESLTTWLEAVRNFFARDDNFVRFTLPGAVWDPNHPGGMYGFQAEGPNTKLRRPAAEVHAALLRMFSSISAFFPYSFLTRRFEQTTSWDSIRQLILSVYNFQLNSASLLQSVEVLKRPAGENYYIYYERVLDYFLQHLVGPNVVAGGFNTGPNGDDMSLSQNNLIALIWLQKIDARLPKLVQTEYGAELRNHTQLVTLVPRIANDMELLLSKLDSVRLNMVQESFAEINVQDSTSNMQDSINRVFRGRGGFSNTRGGRGGFNRAPGAGRGRDRQPEYEERAQLHCAHCKHLGKELGVRIPFDHGPLTCRRRRVHVRRIPFDEYELAEVEDEETLRRQAEEQDFEGENPVSSTALSNNFLLQTSESEPRVTVEEVDPGGVNVSESILLRVSPHSTAENPSLISPMLSELPAGLYRVIKRVVSDLLSPTRASSPSILAELRGKTFRVVIDSGAELNCISLQFAREMQIPFVPTAAEAKGAGDKDIALAGVTTADVIIYSDFNGQRIPINLQRSVVVDELGVDILAGEPAMQSNELGTDARGRNVFIRYNGVSYGKPYLNDSRGAYAVVKPNASSTVYPGGTYKVSVPENLAKERVLLFACRRDGPRGFNTGYLEVKQGQITVTNGSSEEIQVRSGKPIGEVRAVCEIKVKNAAASKTSGNQAEPDTSYEQKIATGKFEKQVGFQSDEKQIGLTGKFQLSDRGGPTCQAEIQGPDCQGCQLSDVDVLSEIGYRPEVGGLTESHWEDRSEDSGTCERSSSSETRIETPKKETETSGSKVGKCRTGETGDGSQTGKEPPPARARSLRPLESGDGAGAGGSRIAGLAEYPSGSFRYAKFGDPEPEPQPDPDIVLDPDGVMTPAERDRARQISREFHSLFTKRPGKYNGYYGRVSNSLQFSSPPTPNSKIYMPSYSDKQLEEMGRQMDTLIQYGVLQRPEDVGVTPVVVSPSMLVPKNDKGEFRVVTDLSRVNKHIKKLPSTSPTIQEARNALAKKRFFIHIDLANFFFQCGIDNKDAQFLATFHPFKGLLVYVVTPQGMKGSSEQGYEMLGRVYGDMVADKRLARQADSLFPLGDTVKETLDNYAETLRRAELAGLTFKPGKTVICPQSITLFGWRLSGSKWLPTDHTLASLSVAVPPPTVRGLRGFLGAFKQYTECVPKYAELLHQLEKLVGGRGSAERIVWTEDNLLQFEKAKRAAGDVTAVTVPRPSDKLYTYSDYSADTRAVGGRLEIVREEDGRKVKYHGGYFSVVLDKFKAQWFPCEAEAAGVRLTLEHFEPYIRENLDVTTHFTDNLPTVQAWRRCLQGKFSASSRISTFLVGVSALSVELVHKPGKDMHSADYGSRNPVHCREDSNCQICKFAEVWQMKGDKSSLLGSVTVKDILEGRSLMPYIQLKTWLGQQLNDRAHVAFRKLVETGQLPEKKKTGGEHTIVKHLYAKYQAGEVTIRPDGLVLVRVKEGYFSGKAISVPHQLLAGIAFSIHVKLDHPSKGQLLALMARYFYCHGHTTIIQSVVDNCVQCRSLQPVPKEFLLDTTEKPEGLGALFAVDVMERHGQKIMLTREKLSQYTWLELIPDQTTDTFRKVIFRTVLPWVHPVGAKIRCDGAAALSSLAKETKDPESTFYKYNISLEVGRPHNVNKNAIAENAIKEAEKEILKYRPHKKALSDEDLVVVSKIMNDRIRNRGVTAKEILTRRDCVSGKPKDISDKELAESQFDKRVESNKRALARKPGESLPAQFNTGDVVYIKAQRSKHQPREQFIVTGFAGDMVVIQKLHSRFANKEYTMYQSEIMPAGTRSGEIFDQTKTQVETEEATADSPEIRIEPPDLTEDMVTGARRKRGRPRKHPRTPSPVIEEAPGQGGLDTSDRIGEQVPSSRSKRALARQARRELKNPDICLVDHRPDDAALLSRLYRPGTTRYVCPTDYVETHYYPDTTQWWWFPPDGNYEWMDNDEWVMPNLEEWGEADLVQGELVREVGEGAALLQDIEPLDVSSEMEDESPDEDDVTVRERQAADHSFGAELQQLARQPGSHGQVNLGRVVNLSDLPAAPDIGAGDQDEPPRPRRSRRSEASKRKPDRYQ